eukprot:TRINITY_DN219_c0_g1_i1.p1 TRINITY_DN219_c0_g1~~TRINITY_DN219_c0_g1_i1.p1  ORF type:complete len:265 (-),score=45.73 TRINITY_DN219_c0_g1_i1:641-1324(-)
MSNADDDETTMDAIEYPDQVFELNCHPSKNVVAAALVSGEVFMHSYGVASHTKVASFSHHKKSCRTLQFSDDGKSLFTASSDKSLAVIDAETAQVVHHHIDAHKNPINTLKQQRNFLLTGDDEGLIKIWDLRQQKATHSVTANSDFISEFAIDVSRNTVLASSADGQLSVIHLRTGKVKKQSDDQEVSACFAHIHTPAHIEIRAVSMNTPLTCYTNSRACMHARAHT